MVTRLNKPSVRFVRSLMVAIIVSVSLALPTAVHADSSEVARDPAMHSRTAISSQVENAPLGFVWMPDELFDELTCHRVGKLYVREEADIIDYKCLRESQTQWRLHLYLYI